MKFVNVKWYVEIIVMFWFMWCLILLLVDICFWYWERWFSNWFILVLYLRMCGGLLLSCIYVFLGIYCFMLLGMLCMVLLLFVNEYFFEVGGGMSGLFRVVEFWKLCCWDLGLFFVMCFWFNFGDVDFIFLECNGMSFEVCDYFYVVWKCFL